MLKSNVCFGQNGDVILDFKNIVYDTTVKRPTEAINLVRVGHVLN